MSKNLPKKPKVPTFDQMMNPLIQALKNSSSSKFCGLREVEAKLTKKGRQTIKSICLNESIAKSRKK